MEYKKPVLTIEEQINLLQSRGLIIVDRKNVGKYLKNISYYHLSTYFKHFQNEDDSFREGKSFDDVLNIYVFDQKLRLLLLDILERIEKSFKCRLVYEMSVKTGNPFWIADPAVFRTEGEYYYRIREILDGLKSSKESCIRHYFTQYGVPEYPPAWMIIETLTFGQCVMIYNQLTFENQEVVAMSYGINKRHISNWMYALSSIRNLCAHHARLWNNEFFITLNQRHGIYRNYFYNGNGNRLFNYLVVLHVINCKFNPRSSWVVSLKDIIAEHEINVSHMGFPEDWKKRLMAIREIGEKELAGE